MSTGGGSSPYLPFDGGRFRLAMGLMPLALDDWLEMDGQFADYLAQKRRLRETQPDEIFAVLPEAMAPAAELLALLAEHLPRHYPAAYRRDGDRLANLVTGEVWPLAEPGLHPLDLAGRLVQEDLCLLDRDGDTHRLVGASLCFPARWRLADKIGRPLMAIHAAVPGYAAKLGAPVDRFFGLLRAEKPVWRLNWGLTDDPALFQAAPTAVKAIPPDEIGARVWLRVERQTLRRLPATGAVLFTIRTYLARLDAAICTAEAAADLAGAIRSMPPETQRYKSIAPLAPALLHWLDAGANAISSGPG
jgi:dimethylamine monooxygenase subunit A